MQVDCSYNSDAKLIRIPSVRVSRTDRIPTGKCSNTSSRLLVAPELKQTAFSGNDSIPRQCATVGDSKNDKERSDDLFIIAIRQPYPKDAKRQESV